MELKVLNDHFSVCKIRDIKDVDYSGDFVFFSKTDEELSLVCRSDLAPADCVAIEKGWRGFRVQGELDFSLIGILSKLSSLLAANGISIFAVSTYNTDYVLLKEESLENAVAVLKQNGYEIV